MISDFSKVNMFCYLIFSFPISVCHDSSDSFQLNRLMLEKSKYRQKTKLRFLWANKFHRYRVWGKTQFFKWNRIGTVVSIISTVNKEYIHIWFQLLRWHWNTTNGHKTLQQLFVMLSIHLSALLNSHSCFLNNVC